MTQKTLLRKRQSKRRYAETGPSLQFITL